jgi:ankyrin repeat protein
MTPLHYAAEYGCKDIVLLLIDKHNAVIEARDKVSWSIVYFCFYAPIRWSYGY